MASYKFVEGFLSCPLAPLPFPLFGVIVVFARPSGGRVNALGFALVRRKGEGLKPEYRELGGKAIGDLK